VYLLYGAGCLLYTVPIYTMAGLRRGLGKWRSPDAVLLCCTFWVLGLLSLSRSLEYCFTSPAHTGTCVFTRLRRAGYYLYFNLMTLLSVYCNLCLAYLITMLVERRAACKLVYAGVLLPLQLLMSGYMPLIRTMPAW
jgi:hypothetical protein